jgi:uncharacterized SAM-binding protein YcdF (DUF218 family)
MAMRRKRRFWWRNGVPLLLIAFSLAYLVGLFGFAAVIPREVEDPDSVTDAVVVLTGGSLRLTAGFHLFAERRAPLLFISGVNPEVELRSLPAFAGADREALACCVSLGHAAGDTIGNAEETAEWATSRGVHSIRLVTAAYHMPRSLLEFRRLMPATGFVPHPVFPPGFNRDRWWGTAASINLVVGEYTKYLGARLRHSIADLVQGA